MKSLAAYCAAGLLFLCGVCSSEEPTRICGHVEQALTAKNYPKALEELSRTRAEVERLHNTQLQTYFPDQLAGFAGQKLEASNMLGLSNVGRTYTRGNQEAAKLSLIGTANGSAGGGSLADLGRMAAMFGGQGSGQDTIRIAGRPATLDRGETGGNPKLTVYLDSGSMLAVEMTKGKDIEAMKALAGGMNLEALDTYLKGAK